MRSAEDRVVSVDRRSSTVTIADAGEWTRKLDVDSPAEDCGEPAQEKERGIARATEVRVAGRSPSLAISSPQPRFLDSDRPEYRLATGEPEARDRALLGSLSWLPDLLRLSPA